MFLPSRKTLQLICVAALWAGLGANLTAAVAQTAQQRLSTKQSNELELEQVSEQFEQVTARQQALREEIAALDKDIGAINRALLTSAKQGQDLETQISQAEANLAALVSTQKSLQNSLRGKRKLLSQVLGALQRMGRNPPPALLISPRDALSSVHSAILLGSVVPEIRGQTKTLLAQLQTLVTTTEKVRQGRSALADKLNALAEDEARLSLLIEEKNELTLRSREELEAERQKASKLAARASSLKQLIGDLEGQIQSAARAAQAARAADARRREEEKQRLAAAQAALRSGKPLADDQAAGASAVTGDRDPTRIEPAIAFGKAKGQLVWPASARMLYGYGETTSNPHSRAADGRSRNLALATRTNARVLAPSDGWVVYAGPFRSYGQLLILNAGDGYHMIMAGLAQVNVETGRFVLAGEPVGRMGSGANGAEVTAVSPSIGPVLYIELRKNGIPLDPTPWWDQKQMQQARNLAQINAGEDGS